MRFDLNNIHLDIEPVYDDILIRFKEDRIITQEHIQVIEADVMKLADAAAGNTITLDFEKVRSLSSSFLGFLVKLNSTMKQNKGRLRLRNLHPDVFKIFKITGLQKLFTIEGNK